MYTITFVRQDRTDIRPKTWRISRFTVALLVCFFVGTPLLGFYLSYRFIAPAWLEVDIANLQQQRDAAYGELNPLQAQYAAVVEENAEIRAQAASARQQAAELEARLTIAETSQQEAANKAALLEETQADLARQVKFYEALMKPSSEQLAVQCFNIEASLSKNKVQYAVSFIKNNQADKTSLTAKVALRVLTGADAVNLQNGRPEVKPSQTKSITFTQDYRLNDSFTVANMKETGLRLLDITAYNSAGEELAHCWKAF